MFTLIVVQDICLHTLIYNLLKRFNIMNRYNQVVPFNSKIKFCMSRGCPSSSLGGARTI